MRRNYWDCPFYANEIDVNRWINVIDMPLFLILKIKYDKPHLTTDYNQDRESVY